MSSAEILARQSAIVDIIKNLETNYKKDGASRKTLSYLMQKLSTLESVWQEFVRNHAILEDAGECTGEYFEKNIYEKLSELYTSFKNSILKASHNLTEQTMQTPKSPQATDESKVQQLLNEQRTNIKAFERQVKKLDISGMAEKWQLEDELKTITMRWENIDRLYWKIDNISENNEIYESDYDRLESIYKNTKEKINIKIMSNVHREKSSPKVELPIFNGNYEHWITFRDLFTESVHLNPFIAPTQKMQHLKSKLRGEAEKLIQHLSISADNYITAWGILSNRYDNNRLLFTHYANVLLNQPIIQRPTAVEFKKLHDITLECLNGISNLEVDITSWDPLIVHIIMQKLDSETVKQYIESLKHPRELSTMHEFLDFLEIKFMALESSGKAEQSAPKNNNESQNSSDNANYKQGNKKSRFFKNKKPSQSGNTETPSKSFHAASWNCPQCEGSHGLYMCREFLEMKPKERLRTAEKLDVCKNCLFSHNGNKCKSTRKCKTCDGAHSTLLHEAIENVSQSQTKQKKGEQSQQLSSHVSRDDLDEVLLATVQLKVQTADGNYITFRALLDQGSQLTLITENAVQQLNIKRNKYDAVVSGLGADTSNKCKGEVYLQCQSIHDSQSIQVKALIMNRLTNKLPNKQFDKNSWTHITNLKLADPLFNIPGEIDILLGADVYSNIIMSGLIRGNNTNIIAQQTQLGWIVCGNTKTYNCHVVLNNTEDLYRFWEQEEICDKTSEENSDDYCEKLYRETTTRLPDGRYQVRIPMKPGFEGKLGVSKPRAVAIFKQLEKRMDKNIDFANDYKQFIYEYEDMRHMKKSTESAVQYFLPHHDVIRAEAITTKLRVVFNASAKTNSGLSLNDLMESGPNLQADLQTLLLQWRQYKYAFTADLEKMFRFIAIHPEDQHLQKIVWRNAPNKPITTYQLCTVTYGTKAAPYLAQRTLKQLAEDEGVKFPLAKPILQNKFYMDDVLFGADTSTEARQIRDELINLLRCGGFNLRKWSSNEQTLVEDLAENMRNPCNFNFTDTGELKTLGLSWNPKNDLFVFSSPIKQNKNKNKTYTKRQLLSEIAMLFDPLGWLSPVTIKMKILFQQVWLEKTTWDESLPEHITKQWKVIKDDLVNINTIKLPRWLGFNATNIDVELHAFSDASEKAYSAVVYCTVRTESGETKTNLIASKTKVAPIKNKVSLPRLELCGALLVAKLLQKITQTYSNTTFKTTAWTDSMVVLGWLQGDIQRWNTYVANRVREIRSIISPAQWHYVKSHQNPADCATRGLLPTQLAQFELWWKGPEWLEKTDKSSEKTSFVTNIETKTQTLTVQNKTAQSNLINELINKCSSVTKAIRTLAWVSRFTTNARGARLRHEHLTLAEIQNARLVIIKQAQNDSFEKEIEDLKGKGRVKNNSNILKLNPKLDENGILRVGGRLKNSQLPYDAKCPIILPQKHRLTSLLIEQAHVTTLHGGPRLTQTYLRQYYWIIGGNNTIKKQIRKCVRCVRFASSQPTQLMSDLPKERVTPSRPFTNCGIDYAGPVDIKANKGRGIKLCKGYIALFICMVTKAIHLELVSDLSSQAFIAALKRMTARRGIPKNIYSDNGTNFVGANKELKKQFKEHNTFYNDTFTKITTEMEIEWHFNAPGWPTAGGLWEAAVKSMKHHLKRVLGEQKLTFEEFSTLLTQVEACLNSRPLCSLTEDIDDLEYVLTPGHFLVGQPLTTLPQENLTEERTLTKRWQLTTKLYQDFWKKWSSEYLNKLQTRCKWNKPSENLKNGDVVIMKEENIAPAHWAIARVQETHPGSDGLVRVVSLKTKRGTIKRPITKLIKLPIDQPNQQTPPASPPAPPPKLNKNIKKPNGATYLCFFLSLMTIITCSLQQTINITPLESERRVYYDHIGNLQNIHESWVILTYFNMTTYWQGIHNINAYIQHIDGICQQFSYKRVCDSIVTELKQEMEEIEHNNYLLRSQQTFHLRTKRGLINAVGQLANTLFGVLDERFAEQYQQDIEMVKMNENHLLNLLKNQTSILESQNNILQRNENSMTRQLEQIKNHIKEADIRLIELQNKTREDILMTYFNSVTISANIIITKLHRMQDSITYTLSNIHKGHVDSTILSQEQILHQLRVIAARLPGHLSLPVKDIHNELSDIYKLLHVKARVTNNYFIMEIKLPLVHDTQFQLYSIIPLPYMSHEKTITARTSLQYVAVNILKDIYIGISQSDLQSCVILQENKYICTFNKPVHNMRQSKLPCEISFLVNNNSTTCDYNTEYCANEWIGLHRRNTWIYICCDVCELHIICGEHFTTRNVRHSGIISVDGQGCTIKRDETIIQTDTVYQNKLFIDPAISALSFNDLNNITKLTPPNQLKEIIETHGQTFKDIKKQINELKQNSEIPMEINAHDIHQYAISYLALIIILIICIGGGVYMIKRKQLLRRNQHKNNRNEEIEMASLPTTRKKPIYAKPLQKPAFNL